MTPSRFLFIYIINIIIVNVMVKGATKGRAKEAEDPSLGKSNERKR